MGGAMGTFSGPKAVWWFPQIHGQDKAPHRPPGTSRGVMERHVASRNVTRLRGTTRRLLESQLQIEFVDTTLTVFKKLGNFYETLKLLMF